MDIVKKAKDYLNRDCKTCKYYSIVGDNVELCRKRQWNSISGHAVGSIYKKYGIKALPIYTERSCKDWEAN